MATTKVLTYDVNEVCKMLGMESHTAYNMIKKNKFPFPVIQVGDKRWVVPRKAVDKALKEGKGGDRTESTAKKQGRPTKWVKGEYTTWNFRIPVDLADAFHAVVDAMNKELAAPVSYLDARLLAFQEFIERRPISED